MESRTAILCIKCKEVFNNEDDIFGTSCGHLYHFHCLRECHGKSENCSDCESYKPFIFKMFLEFVEAPTSWEDKTKTIELLNLLQNSDNSAALLEEKYKISQLSLQKTEANLKKFRDAIISKDIAISELEERIASLEISQNKVFVNEKSCPPSSKENAECNELDSGLLKQTTLIDQKEEKTIEKTVIANGILENCLSDIELSKMNKCSDSEEILKKNQNLNNSKKEKEYEGHQSGHNTKSRYEERTSASNTVIISNYRLKYLKKFCLEETIIYLASKMNIPLAHNEIKNVVSVKNNKSKTATLFVTFENDQYKQKFISNKSQLKKFSNTNFLNIEG